MDKIFTIGFTQKTAEVFFESLKKNNVSIILDIRLNNTSQLAGFSKYPDIKYFLKQICSIDYISDTQFAPTKQILNDCKSKKISWNDYVLQFNQLMDSRNINEYIKQKYDINNICLLCSEPKPDNCHRSLVANRFSTVFSAEIVHIV